MKRKQLKEIDVPIPTEFQPLLNRATVFDSSCSPEARVWMIDRDGGYYLKRGARGSLEAEARMTRYFHQKGLGTEVLSYLSGDYDWLLTARVVGEDCTHADYLADPRRLCDTIAERLRALHETDFSDCPIADRMSGYCATVEENYRTENYDKSAFPDSLDMHLPRRQLPFGGRGRRP